MYLRDHLAREEVDVADEEYRVTEGPEDESALIGRIVRGERSVLIARASISVDGVFYRDATGRRSIYRRGDNSRGIH